MNDKIAYRIHELVELGPLGRTSIYAEIAAGRLTARKIRGVTFVLTDEWDRFLREARAVA